MEGFMSADLEVKDKNQLAFMNWFSKNYAYTILLILPLDSFASYLSFRKYGLNFLEHFVANCYITGQQAILYTIGTLAGLPFEKTDLIVSVAFVLSVFFTFWVFWQLFHDKPKLSVILRTFITYLLSVFFLGVFLFSILGITELM